MRGAKQRRSSDMPLLSKMQRNNTWMMAFGWRMQSVLSHVTLENLPCGDHQQSSRVIEKGNLSYLIYELCLAIHNAFHILGFPFVSDYYHSFHQCVHKDTAAGSEPWLKVILGKVLVFCWITLLSIRTLLYKQEKRVHDPLSEQIITALNMCLFRNARPLSTVI